MIAAARVVVANKNQCRASYIAEAMSRFPIVPGDDQVNVRRELRVSRPNKLEKRLDFIRMLFAIIVSEESAGIAVFFPQSFFKTLLHQPDHEPVRQTRNAVRTRPDRLTGTACRHDQAFYPAGKIEREFQGDAAAHGMTDEMRGFDSEMIQQRHDLVGHLINRINLLRRDRTTAAARVVNN